MDDNKFDDDYSPRVPVHHNEDSFAAMHRDFDATPESEHQRHEEAAAKALAENSVGRALLDPKQSVEIITNPDDIAALKAAAEKDAADAQKAAEDASKPTLTTPPEIPPTGAVGTDATTTNPSSNASSTVEAPDKPSSLESTLNNIRYNGERQRRLVISGPPEIEKAFHATLAARGLLYNQGGTPIMACSRKEALQVLAETVKRFDNADMHHALSMEMQREGGGILGSISAGIKNNLGIRSHRVDVILVGTETQRSEKMKELSAFVEIVASKGLIKEGAAEVKNGALVTKEPLGTVKIKATAQLDDVLFLAKNKVETYNASQAVLQKELREHKAEKDKASMAKDREKAGEDSLKGEGKTPVNTFASGIATRLASAIENPNSLTAKLKNGTEGGVLILRDSRTLQDPASKELSTLPDGPREKAIVQLAALTQKANDGLFGKGFKAEVNNPKDGGESNIREKVDDFIAMEAKRDPSLDAKAAPILQDMVDRGVLTEKQSADITLRIASAVAEAKATAAKEASVPVPDVHADKSAGPATPGETTASLAATTKAPEGDKSDAAKASAPDASSGKADARVEPTFGPPVTPDSPPKDVRIEPSFDATAVAVGATSADAVKASEGSTPAAQQAAAVNGREPSVDIPSTSASGVAVGATSSAGIATAEAQTSAAEKPLELRDRIALLVNEGPANFTAEKAHSLVAQLDAIRTKSISALDSNSNVAPTQTLARTDMLLKALESGRFGDELKARATDLREPLEKWGRQDAARYSYENAISYRSRADVVAKTQQADSAWSVTTSQQNVTSAAGSAVSRSDTQSASTGESVSSTQKSAETVNAVSGSVSRSGAQSESTGESVSSTQKSAETVNAVSGSVSRSGAQSESTGESVSSTQKSAETVNTRTDSAAQSDSRTATESTAQASQQRDADKAQLAQRITETESAGGKLSMMMANPPGSFTNRDKTWNEAGVQRAASEVLRIDPDSVAHLSGPQRAKLAAFSAWVAENARDGKLPGFDSEAGKAQATQLVERAAALIGKMDSGSQLTPDTQKLLTKADNMVNAMEKQMQNSAATAHLPSSEAGRGGVSSKAVAALASDLVHEVYKRPEMSEHLVKYHLKNSGNFTQESMKDLSPQARAQTAVALSYVVQEVRGGALGDFAKLPAAVQKQTLATATVAENLLTKMGADPAMRSELYQAYSDLQAKNSGATKDHAAPTPKMDGSGFSEGAVPAASKDSKATSGSSPASDTSTSKVESTVTKSEGRSHDR